MKSFFFKALYAFCLMIGSTSMVYLSFSNASFTSSRDVFFMLRQVKRSDNGIKSLCGFCFLREYNMPFSVPTIIFFIFQLTSFFYYLCCTSNKISMINNLRSTFRMHKYGSIRIFFLLYVRGFHTLIDDAQYNIPATRLFLYLLLDSLHMNLSFDLVQIKSALHLYFFITATAFDEVQHISLSAFTSAEEFT